jgi:hypothetical protein
MSFTSAGSQACGGGEPELFEMLMNQKRLRLYFENAVGRVMEHPEGYVRVEYKPGARNLSDLQAFLHHTGQLLQLRGWRKLLGDQRLMAPFDEVESKWIVEYWLERFNQQQTSLYGAILVPQDVFARLSVNNVMHEARAAALTYRMFNSETDALAWLGSVG